MCETVLVCLKETERLRAVAPVRALTYMLRFLPLTRPVGTSSEDVCKRGFTVIIDMRGSKWELIKPLLKTLQEFFPAEICVALIIKPDNFWQKQKTNFGSAKFSFEVSGEKSERTEEKKVGGA